MFDLVFRQAGLSGHDGPRDIGVAGGRIAAIAPHLPHEGPEEHVEGRLVFPGFVETHIHLDKASILDRCPICAGTLAEAVSLTARAKAGFSEEDVYRRARSVVDKAIGFGTTRLRSFVEVDPRAGLRSLAAIRRLKADTAHAVDLEICAFAQEGITQEIETLGLLDRALSEGADLVGGCPYTDPDPLRHVGLVFDLAEKHGVRVDFHVDFDLRPENSHLGEIARQTRRRGFAGRVSVGHATKLSALPPPDLDAAGRLLADAGIALVVLPATDLFINGRDATHLVPRGVAPAHRLEGVVAAIGSNNLSNPFTPFGDASLLRMANLYANVAQLASDAEMERAFAMVGREAAQILGGAYGITVGEPADLVVLDAPDAVTAIREIALPLAGWKRGRPSFRRPPVRLFPQHRDGT